MAGRRPLRANIDSMTFWAALVATSIAVVALGLALLGWAAVSAQLDAWALANTVALALTTAALALFWSHVVFHEGRLLERITRPLNPGEPRSMFLRVVVSLTAMLVLFPAAVSPATYGLALAVLKVVESSNAHRVKSEFLDLADAASHLEEAAIAGAGFASRDQYLKEVETHRIYYFDHPWALPLAGEMLALTVAIAAASYAIGQTDLGVRHALALGATALIIVAVVANEIVAAHWRGIRDSKLPVSLGLF